MKVGIGLKVLAAVGVDGDTVVVLNLTSLLANLRHLVARE